MSYVYKNGYWHRTVISKGVPIEILFAGSEEKMPFNQSFISKIEGKASAYYELAVNFAYNSVYLEDIEKNGGIKPDSMVVSNEYLFYLWFNFVDWDNGYLGVVFENEYPKSIYCDH
jgi:hypothetical protein